MLIRKFSIKLLMVAGVVAGNRPAIFAEGTPPDPNVLWNYLEDHSHLDAIGEVDLHLNRVQRTEAEAMERGFRGDLSKRNEGRHIHERQTLRYQLPSLQLSYAPLGKIDFNDVERVLIARNPGRVEHLTDRKDRDRKPGSIRKTLQVPVHFFFDTAFGLRRLNSEVPLLEEFDELELVTRGRADGTMAVEHKRVAVPGYIDRWIFQGHDLVAYESGVEGGASFTRWSIEHDEDGSPTKSVLRSVTKHPLTGAEHVLWAGKIDVQKWDRDPVDMDLRIQWPPGTSIYDHRLEMNVTTGAKAAALSDEELFELVAGEQAEKERIDEATEEVMKSSP